MEKININLKIMDALALSLNERKVFEVLLATLMGNTASKIARKSGVPRTTTIDVLKRLEERKLVTRSKWGARDQWRYKKGLEKM